jgi:hypothetical protein
MAQQRTNHPDWDTLQVRKCKTGARTAASRSPAAPRRVLVLPFVPSRARSCHQSRSRRPCGKSPSLITSECFSRRSSIGPVEEPPPRPRRCSWLILVTVPKSRIASIPDGVAITNIPVPSVSSKARPPCPFQPSTHSTTRIATSPSKFAQQPGSSGSGLHLRCCAIHGANAIQPVSSWWYIAKFSIASAPPSLGSLGNVFALRSNFSLLWTGAGCRVLPHRPFSENSGTKELFLSKGPVEHGCTGPSPRSRTRRIGRELRHTRGAWRWSPQSKLQASNHGLRAALAAPSSGVGPVVVR